MNAENVNQILDVLAARFGSTGAHLWLVLQRQAWVEFYTALAFVPVLIAVWVAFLRWPEPENRYYDSFPREVTVGGLVIATIGLLICLATTGQGVLNPEYYALHEVLRSLQ